MKRKILFRQMIRRQCTYEFILLSEISKVTAKQFRVLQIVKHYQTAHLNYTAKHYRDVKLGR